MKKRFASLLCCLLFAVPAFAQSGNVIFRWPSADRNSTMLLAAILSATLAVLLSFYLWSIAKRAKIEREASTRLFGDGCKRCDLTAEEARFLDRVASYAPDAQTKSHMIFDVRVLFERCVDAYVANNSRAAHSSDSDLLSILRRKLGFAIIAADHALLSTRNISTGQKASIFIGKPAIGKSVVVTHVNEFYFTVRQPPGYGYARYQNGSEITIAFMRQGDAAYSATTKVRGTSASGEEVGFFHTLKLSRSQNRRYLRLDARLPIKYIILEKALPGDEKKALPEQFQARTFDIGGGGMSFVTGERHLAGDLIQFTITVGGRVLRGIKAKILHIIPIGAETDDEADWCYRYLAQFTTIEPPQREHIIKYIFEKQREMLQMR